MSGSNNNTVGTQYNPHPLPNVKKPKSGIDIIAQFPPFIIDKMKDRPDVQQSIRDVPTIKNTLVKNEDGSYRLSDSKKIQGPYDDFMRELTKEYGSNKTFRNGPRKLDHFLFGQISTDTEAEFIFGVVETVKDGLQIMVLPRTELLEHDGEFYTARHTHREFLKGDPNASLIAAGTMFVVDGLLKFNFRTGHFNVHKDRAINLEEIRSMMLELVSFANDKTLGSDARKYSSLLAYEAEHKADHDVIAEFGGDVPPGFVFTYGGITERETKRGSSSASAALSRSHSPDHGPNL